MNETKKKNAILDIDLKDIALLLLKRLWLIIIVFTLFFSYRWFFIEQKKTPTYTATASMYVTNSDAKKYSYNTSDTYNATNLIKTCGVAMNSNYARQLIADKLNQNEELLVEEYAEQGVTYTPEKYSITNIGQVSVESIEETEVMQISVTTNDKDSSVKICNAILDVVPDMLKDRIKVGAAEVLDRAGTYIIGNRPNMRQTILFGAIGAAGMAVLIVVAYLLDNRIKSKEELTDQYGIPVLSEIPNFNTKSKERYTTYYEHR